MNRIMCELQKDACCMRQDYGSNFAYRIALYAIILISGAVYLPSIDGLALWDDRSLIGAYRSLSQCFTVPFLQHYFRPLVSLTFFAEWRLFGRDAFICHQTNVLIHLCTTAALIGLLRSLFPNRWIAALGGLLFAVQPAQASTVAWIGGRTDSLCTLWIVLFLLSLVRSARASGARAWMYGVVSVILFELALLTKEQSLAVLPIVPIVHLWFCHSAESEIRTANVHLERRVPQNWGVRGRIQNWGAGERTRNTVAGWRRAFLFSLPFIAAAALFVALWFLNYPDPRLPQAIPMGDRLVLAGNGATYYALLLFAPSHRWLHTLTLNSFNAAGIWTVPLGFALLAYAIGMTMRARKRNPAVALLGVFALLTYLPVSNLVPMPSLFAAPYRVGICGPAVAALMAVGLITMVNRLSREAQAWRRQSLVLIAASFALWCTYVTVTDNRAWMSQQALFAEFHACDPDNIPTTCQYSRELIAVGRAREAVTILETMLDHWTGDRRPRTPEWSATALSRNPGLARRLRLQYGSDEPVSRRLGGVLGDLASARNAAGDRDGARLALASALTVDRTNPYTNLVAARFAFADGRYSAAHAALRVSLAAQCERYDSHKLMSEILIAQQRWRGAEPECQACIALEPWRVEPYRLLAFARREIGDMRGAQLALRSAIADSEGDHIEERAALSTLARVAQLPWPASVHAQRMP